MIQVDAKAFTAAVNSAGRVAPVKGQGYDAAAGIVLMEVDGRLEVRATDLDTTFQESLDVEAPEGFFARLPHVMLTTLVSTLGPMEVVEIDRVDNHVSISSGAFSADLNHIVGEYPATKAFEWDGWAGTPMIKFADAIKRVSWGAGRRGEMPFDGIHFDGEMIVASDKVSFVQFPFEMELPAPITVPLTSLASVVPRDAVCEVSASPNRLRVSADLSDGRRLMLSSTIYAKEFPKLDSVRDWAFDPPYTSRVDRGALETSVKRMQSRVKLTFVGDELVLEIWHEDIGYVVDRISAVNSQPDPFEVWMDPNRLIDIARSVPSDEIVIGHQGEARKPMAFMTDDDSGFLCVAMPMVVKP